MSETEIKLKALSYLETHNIDIENLKECDAYNENYFIKWHFNEGLDTHNEMFVDNLFQGIIDLVEKK